LCFLERLRLVDDEPTGLSLHHFSAERFPTFPEMYRARGTITPDPHRQRRAGLYPPPYVHIVAPLHADGGRTPACSATHSPSDPALSQCGWPGSPPRIRRISRHGRGHGRVSPTPHRLIIWRVPWSTRSKNARVVTRDDDFIGSVLVRDGRIAAVDRGAGQTGEDLEGDILMPGIIDIHTDNLEKHF